MDIFMMRSPLKVFKVRSAVSAVLLLLTLIVGTSLFAQNPNGALRGEVQDSSGARVSTAQVAVESVDSSIRREAVANDHGEFRIDGLLPGRYKVSASAKGFASASSEV
jgi:hypothetical protein